MVDATVLNKPAASAPAAAPAAAPKPAPPVPTFPLMEICDDELRAVLGIAHARTIASSLGDVDVGTAEFLDALGDTFLARGNLQTVEREKEAWNDLARAVKAVGELARYMGLE
jgi:hypothetical protein